MVHRAFGAFKFIIHVAQPCSTQTEQGLLLDGDFSAFLGLEKIPQPDNFKNMYPRQDGAD
jgi:hypothetical protein